MKLFNHEIKSSFWKGLYFENPSIEEEYNEFLRSKLKLNIILFSVSIFLYHCYDFSEYFVSLDKTYDKRMLPVIVALYSASLVAVPIFASLLVLTKFSMSKHRVLCNCLLFATFNFYLARLIKLSSVNSLKDLNFDEVSSGLNDTLKEELNEMFLGLFKNTSISEINIFRASIEGFAYFAYSLKAPFVILSSMIALKFGIFLYFAIKVLQISILSAALGLVGIIAIYSFSFYLKRNYCQQLLEIFVHKKSLQSTNEYFAGFIRDLNNPILTIDQSKNYLNSNPIFLREISNLASSKSETLQPDTSNYMKSADSINPKAQMPSAFNFINRLRSFDVNESLTSLIDSICSSKQSNPSKCNIEPAKFNVFTPLGLHYLEHINSYKFYEIAIRSFYIYDRLVCLDLVFHDVTQLKNTEATNTEIQIKGNMFSKIAHEFKTPLITITSQLEVLDEKLKAFEALTMASRKGQELLQERLNDIQEISQSIKHLAHYTNFLILDIIHYSSKSKKEIDIKYETISEIKKDVVMFSDCVLKALLSYSSGNKDGIKSYLIWDEEISHYRVSTDKTRLNQVLLNLISNSVKFVQCGYIELRCYLKKNQSLLKVSTDFSIDLNKNAGLSSDIYTNECHFETICSRSDKPQSDCTEMVISIKDTGSGISRKIIEDLKAGETSLICFRDYKNKMGSGLGLGIAKTICSLLNYEFRLASIEGTGTISEIVIPLHLLKNSKKVKVSISSMNEPNIEQEPQISDSSFESEYESPAKPDIPNQIMEPKNKSSKTVFNMTENLRKKKNLVLIFPNESYTANIVNVDHAKATFSTEINNPRISPKLIKLDSLIATKKSETNYYDELLNDKKSKPILVICDDTAVIRDSAEKVYKSVPEVRDSYEILKVNDGSTLISLIIANQKYKRIKAVFTDEYMEYINGSDAISIIKALESKGKLQKGILYFSVTSYEDELFKSRLLQYGFSQVMSKPICKLDLISTLKGFKLIP